MNFMWVIAAILLVAIVIAMIEVPSLFRKRLRKELWVFTILLLLATGLSIAESLQVEIPNPIDWIIAIYKPISDAVTNMLM